MARRMFSRKRMTKKASLEPVPLPAFIAWSTIAALILLGGLQELGRFQPALDTKFGILLIGLILSGGLVSIAIFKFARRRSADAPAADRAKRPERILGAEIQAWWISVLYPLENYLARKQWNPNYITALSFGFNLIGCVFLFSGWLFLAGMVILLGGTLDILDGRIARKTGTVSSRGAFFDSVMDRYSEILIFLGLAAHFRDSILFYVILLGLGGSLMVSYTRARAEGLGITCKVGMMQRPERVVFLGFGAMFSSILHMLRGTLGLDAGPYLMGFILFVIAILSNATAFSRMVYVMRQLQDQHGADRKKAQP
ncbi:MAG: CDP-alcohol phosphatidyltransferase family protein [bacterium]